MESLTPKSSFKAQLYNLVIGERSALNQDSHPYNIVETKAASNILFFMVYGTSLFYLRKDTNFSTWHIFILACSLIDVEVLPSEVKGDPKYTYFTQESIVSSFT